LFLLVIFPLDRLPEVILFAVRTEINLAFVDVPPALWIREP
jgi:hypothetical protein